MGSLGLFGLGLPGVLQAQAASAAAGKPKDDVNVILIWLDGGPSHIDMFDPKPEAPSEVRGEFGVVETNVKGHQDKSKVVYDKIEANVALDDARFAMPVAAKP